MATLEPARPSKEAPQMVIRPPCWNGYVTQDGWGSDDVELSGLQSQMPMRHEPAHLHAMHAITSLRVRLLLGQAFPRQGMRMSGRRLGSPKWLWENSGNLQQHTVLFVLCVLQPVRIFWQELGWCLLRSFPVCHTPPMVQEECCSSERFVCFSMALCGSCLKKLAFKPDESYQFSAFVMWCAANCSRFRHWEPVWSLWHLARVELACLRGLSSNLEHGVCDTRCLREGLKTPYRRGRDGAKVSQEPRVPPCAGPSAPVQHPLFVPAQELFMQLPPNTACALSSRFPEGILTFCRPIRGFSFFPGYRSVSDKFHGEFKMLPSLRKPTRRGIKF